jgi:hypothetical protein
LLIAALSWIWLTRGIVDDQKVQCVLVYGPMKEKKTTTAAKIKYNLLLLFLN